MFITIKKKNITRGVVIAILAISAYLNFGTQNSNVINVASDVGGKEEIETGEAIMVSGQTNHIAESRNNREVVRSKACELLTKTMKDTSVSSDARKQAENALLAMAEAMDKENECESMLGSKGFGECVVFVSEESVNVTVSKKDVSAVDAAKINDIVYSVTNIKNIKIIGAE